VQIEMMPTDRLVPYIRNARTHSADQVAQIAASIAEFGFTNPILIGEDEVIIAGHGRLQAARSLSNFPAHVAPCGLIPAGVALGDPGGEDGGKGGVGMRGAEAR